VALAARNDREALDRAVRQPDRDRPRLGIDDPEAVVVARVDARVHGSVFDARQQKPSTDARDLPDAPVRTIRMDLRVQGMSPDPFLGAADLFETEWSLDDPVHVKVREDPDERTWAGHYDGYHVLNVEARRHQRDGPRAGRPRAVAHGPLRGGARVSHPIDRGGAVPRALRRDGGAPQARALLPDREPHEGHLRRRHHALGRARGQAPRLPRVDPRGRRRRPPRGLPGRRPAGHGRCRPEITAVNAAFALALVERHDIAGPGHRIYDLARAAGSDTDAVDVDAFKERFLALGPDPSESDYRKALVAAARAYAV